MKNKTLLITSVIFVALMVFAYTIYPKLSEKFFDSNVNEQPTSPTEAVSDTLTPETQADTTPTIQAPNFTVYDENGNAVFDITQKTKDKEKQNHVEDQTEKNGREEAAFLSYHRCGLPRTA